MEHLPKSLCFQTIATNVLGQDKMQWHRATKDDSQNKNFVLYFYWSTMKSS
jgi:hypothetical protein